MEKSPKDARTKIFYKNVMAREEALSALTKASPTRVPAACRELICRLSASQQYPRSIHIAFARLDSPGLSRFGCRC